MDSDDLCYNSQLSGWQILFADAEEYVKQGKTYLEWLHHFSRRDASDPLRGGWLSTRAFIKSNFAIAWIHKGGKFTSWEYLMMMNSPVIHSYDYRAPNRDG